MKKFIYFYEFARTRMILSILLTLLGAPAFAQNSQDDDHDHEEELAGHSAAEENEGEDEHGQEEEAELVTFSNSQLAMAGIVVKPIQMQPLRIQLSAPGEVVYNQYRTAYIAPKITAQVTDRRVVLGQEVAEGEPLLTLYSLELLEAQSELLVAYKEWQRVEDLGEPTVGARRFTETKAIYEELYGKVGAYGMSEKEIQDSLIGAHDDHQLGEFDLLAPHSGIVLSDDFSVGETIEAGRTLIKLVDESTVWVEASLPPDIGFRLPENTPALVNIQGSTFEGYVIQQSHLIDEATRTWKVRVIVDNTSHTLHAGLFADVVFTISSESQGLVVPDSALMRVSDGDWTVFIERAPGQFEQMEVEIVQSSPGFKVVEGIPANTRIAVEGAFYIASEMAKSGFDPHDH